MTAFTPVVHDDNNGTFKASAAVLNRYETAISESQGGLATANTQTASYTLVLADAGKVVEMNVAGANALTVPPNSAVAFPIGTTLEICQLGAGKTTLTPGAGVTIRSSGGLLGLLAQYDSARLRKRATNEWVATGDLGA